MVSAMDHVSVCICTFKRPILLDKLLDGLQNQTTRGLFTYSIDVVDNDYAQSARNIVESWKIRSSVSIDYHHEPEQNIALARNEGIRKAEGNLIAFIDDDEFPEPAWLLSLFKAYQQFNADGVLGPVKPHFEQDPPKWVVRGKLFERRRFDTGYIFKDTKNMRTGNVLLAKNLMGEKEDWFNPKFGKTGGEDAEFFQRMLIRGRNFVWCDEASVFEVVPRERFSKSYFLKRALLRGIASARMGPPKVGDCIKSLTAIFIYSSMLPLFFLGGEHWFMKFLIKDCDHLGKMLAYLGWDVLEARSF
jgi:glycosyltransferase involved in cell wall biosynthesis